MLCGIADPLSMRADQLSNAIYALLREGMDQEQVDELDEQLEPRELSVEEKMDLIREMGGEII